MTGSGRVKECAAPKYGPDCIAFLESSTLKGDVGSFAKLSIGEGGEEEVEVGVARESKSLEKEVGLVTDADVRDGD